MRLGLALVVVPNSTLLDNHQDELAEELELQGYATRSDTRSAKAPFELQFLMFEFV
jgi:beta-1,4-N-acetylglucosaminyltransferase